MKALVILITSIFVFGMFQLFLLVAPPRTEKQSASDILAISMEDCDYALDLRGYGRVTRRGDKREATVQKYLNGSPFTGNPVQQVVDPAQGLTSDFPFAEYDSYDAKLLETVQSVIKNKQYKAYNDPHLGYQTKQYYFLISDEGLKQFTEQSYSYGLIVAYYENDVFQRVFVSLYETEGGQVTVDAAFGKLDEKVGLLSGTIATVAPEH